MRTFSPFELHTERLTLRFLGARDVDALFAIYSDPEVARYWSSPPWTERVQAEVSIANALDAYRSGEALRMAIVLSESGQMVGECNLRDFYWQNRRAEVGYALARPSWGQGYLMEALAALLDFGFDKLDLNRIEADIHPANAASAKSLARLGFVQEGLLRERWIVAGEVSDAAYYGLLRSDWRARA
jgi:ribosomal-protein-alanine N-acetyltransferase